MDNAFWQSILDADGAVPEGHTVDELTPELLALLGSTDPILRDEVAYPILDTWIHSGAYSDDRLRALLDQLGENLTAGLGEQDTDSVFLRTFSILVINEILEEDNLRPFLSEAEVRSWLERALAYLADERDLRGYVPGKGWAHSAAHTADTLWVLSRSRYLGAPELERLLAAVANKIVTPVAHIYLHLEDERLAAAVSSALRRDLLELPFLSAWLDRLAHPVGEKRWIETVDDPAQAAAYHNARNFLRSLHIQLVLGVRVPSYHSNPAYFKRAPALRDQLLPLVEGALRALAPGFYAQAT
jgi:hypothetical protein